MAAAMILFVALLGGHRSPITGHFGLTGQSLLSTFIMTPAPRGQQALRERAAAERAEHARAADVAVADGAPERRPYTLVDYLSLPQARRGASPRLAHPHHPHAPGSSAAAASLSTCSSSLSPSLPLGRSRARRTQRRR